MPDDAKLFTNTDMERYRLMFKYGREIFCFLEDSIIPEEHRADALEWYLQKLCGRPCSFFTTAATASFTLDTSKSEICSISILY